VLQPCRRLAAERDLALNELPAVPPPPKWLSGSLSDGDAISTVTVPEDRRPAIAAGPDDEKCDIGLAWRR